VGWGWQGHRARDGPWQEGQGAPPPIAQGRVSARIGDGGRSDCPPGPCLTGIGYLLRQSPNPTVLGIESAGSGFPGHGGSDR
jgi:hypothetical protein